MNQPPGIPHDEPHEAFLEETKRIGAGKPTSYSDRRNIEVIETVEYIHSPHAEEVR